MYSNQPFQPQPMHQWLIVSHTGKSWKINYPKIIPWDCWTTYHQYPSRTSHHPINCSWKWQPFPSTKREPPGTSSCFPLPGITSDSCGSISRAFQVAVVACRFGLSTYVTSGKISPRWGGWLWSEMWEVKLGAWVLDEESDGWSGWWQLKDFLLFIPIPGEMIQFDQYFSNGLKPPTSDAFRFGDRKIHHEKGLMNGLGDGFWENCTGNSKVVDMLLYWNTDGAGEGSNWGPSWLVLCHNLWILFFPPMRCHPNCRHQPSPW